MLLGRQSAGADGLAVMRTSKRRVWQKWLTLLTLACVVGLYTVKVTHVFMTAHDSLVFQKVMAETEASAGLITPPPTPVLPVRVAYYFRWHAPERYFLPYSRDLTPQGRAPPDSTS
jgi:hypothetical protein